LVARQLKTRTLAAFCMLATASTIGSGCTVAEKFSAITGGTDTSTASRSLAFVDHPSVDLGSIAATATTLIRLPISTMGTGNATIDSSSNSDANFTFNGGTFPGTGGTCSQPISGNCSIAILFTAPASPGFYSNVVTIAYTSGGNSNSVSLSLYATVTNGALLTNTRRLKL